MGSEQLNLRTLIEKVSNGHIPYEDLEIDQQVAVYEGMLAGRRTPEKVLLAASQKRRHEFTLVRGDKNCSMDENVYKVKPGNFVLATYETSSAGYSRAQAGFLGDVVEDSLMDPIITIAYLPDSLKGRDLNKISREELEGLILEDVLKDGGVQDIGIDEKHRLIEELRGQGYSNVTMVGEIKEVPTYFNDGVLWLKDSRGGRGVDIDMSNARLIHVIGINASVARSFDPSNN